MELGSCLRCSTMTHCVSRLQGCMLSQRRACCLPHMYQRLNEHDKLSVSIPTWAYQALTYGRYCQCAITLKVNCCSVAAHTHQCTAGSHNDELCNLFKQIHRSLLRPRCKVVLHQESDVTSHGCHACPYAVQALVHETPVMCREQTVQWQWHCTWSSQAVIARNDGITSDSLANRGMYDFSLLDCSADAKNLNCSALILLSTSNTTPLPNVGTLNWYTCSQDRT